MALRDEYLARIEALRNPPAPRLQNTDGEPIAFHRLAFALPSAQEAFDALKELALDEPELDRLESAERAAKLRKLVEALCPDARHTGTEVETVEEALAERGRDVESSGDGDAPALSEGRERLRAMMVEHYDDWLHEELPVLGGLSPLEAVREKSGREKVEALVTQIERHGRAMKPPLDDANTRRMRRQLGLGD